MPQPKKSVPTFKSETFVVKIIQSEGGLALIIPAKKYYQHFLQTYAKAGMEGIMKLELRKPKRSTSQNNFYFAYLGLIALSCGHTVEQLHNWAKGKFLSKGITEVYGDKVREVFSTTELTRDEFVEYLARIEEATEIPVPDPEPFGIGLSLTEYENLKGAQYDKYASMKAKIN